MRASPQHGSRWVCPARPATAISAATALRAAIAARRAGASWEEMQAVINLCFLFRGLPAANRGAEILANIAKREAEAKPA